MFDQLFERALMLDDRSASAVFSWALNPKKELPLLRAPSVLRLGGKTISINCRNSGGGFNSGFSVIDAVAVIPVVGAIFKGGSSYGYADTLELRALLRRARIDDSVKSALLFIDSPGGGLAGIADLRKEIVDLEAKKACYIFAEDLCASGAYFLASAGRKIFANNSTALIGSIGVSSSLKDSSQMYENAGIKIHPIATGAMKSAGLEGAKVTSEQLAHVRELVDSVFEQFVNAVSKTRGITRSSIATMDGKLFDAKQAVALRLVDGICGLDACFAELKNTAANFGGPNGSAAQRQSALERD